MNGNCEGNASHAHAQTSRNADETARDTAQNRKPTPQALALLSYNLQRLRRARGLTQHQLARRYNMGHGYIGDVERDAVNITLGNLEALAIGLGCSLRDLFMPPANISVSDRDESEVSESRPP